MKTKALVLIFFVLASIVLRAQTLPEIQNPPRMVNDFAGILTQEQQNALENELVKFNNETSTQIAIVTVTSLDGDEASDYAFKLGEKWGIGQKGKNNGILILIKPKYGNEKGHAFIATGYGLEGAVPDIYANRIVDLEMIPRFRQNDYYGGIAAAVKTIEELTRGEYTADQYINKKEKTGAGAFIIVFIIFIVILLIGRIGKNQRTLSSRGSSLPFWLLLGSMGSRNHGSFGNFSSGSGSFGGGGFGGFGGGGFGGGGAGGSW